MKKTRRDLLASCAAVLAGLTTARAARGRQTGEAQRRVVLAVAPPFPDSFEYLEIQGDVRVKLTVNPSGDVQSAEVLEAFYALDGFNHTIVTRFAEQWKFEEWETASTVEVLFQYRLVSKDSPYWGLGTFFKTPTTIEIRSHANPIERYDSHSPRRQN